MSKWFILLVKPSLGKIYVIVIINRTLADSEAFNIIAGDGISILCTTLYYKMLCAGLFLDFMQKLMVSWYW